MIVPGLVLDESLSSSMHPQLNHSGGGNHSNNGSWMEGRYLDPNGGDGVFILDNLNGSDFLPGISGSECSGGATEAEMALYIDLTFWMEAVIQSVIGVIGFFANLIVIPILCGENMKSIFNRLLASLVIFDNGYIVLTLLETLRRNSRTMDFFNIIYCYVLYPLRNIVLCCTIYMAIALALERYRAIRHPIQYHNANAGTNPWKKAFTNYLGPVIGFSVITNLPKFLEFEALYQENIHDTYNPELNTITKMKVVEAVIYPTDLRFNHKYVLWYKNVTRLLLTGLIPFVVLVYLNFSVFSVIRRRRHLEHRFINVQSTALKAEAAKQAYVLFAICTTFLFGHILRVVLNIHEFYTLDQVLDGMDNDCFTVKFWTLVTGNVSHLLLTINSSMNILIYCLMSGDFRHIFIRQFSCFGSGICCCLDQPRDRHAQSTPTSTPMGVRGHTNYSTRLLEVTEAIDDCCVPQNSPIDKGETKHSDGITDQLDSETTQDGSSDLQQIEITSVQPRATSIFAFLHRAHHKWNGCQRANNGDSQDHHQHQHHHQQQHRHHHPGDNISIVRLKKSQPNHQLRTMITTMNEAWLQCTSKGEHDDLPGRLSTDQVSVTSGKQILELKPRKDSHHHPHPNGLLTPESESYLIVNRTGTAIANPLPNRDQTAF